jgi:hypothetical protein
MLNLVQFRNYIVRPTLLHMGAYTQAAEQLVLGTALTESRLEFLDQIESRQGDLRPGPAIGLYQMERRTHDDIWAHWMPSHPQISDTIKKLTLPDMNLVDQLRGNLFYATAMCRIYYMRIPRPLPEVNNLQSMGEYWKRFYNTKMGAGTVEGFMAKAAPVMQMKD